MNLNKNDGNLSSDSNSLDVEDESSGEAQKAKETDSQVVSTKSLYQSFQKMQNGSERISQIKMSDEIGLDKNNINLSDLTSLLNPIQNNNDLLIPPPEALLRKSAFTVEQAKTGAPISFLKIQRLLGKERVEKLNPDNNKAEAAPVQKYPPDMPPSDTINDYILNSNTANRLIYCRYGEKYVSDLEKRKNSVLCISNQPQTNLASASYLINIKKLIDEHNIDGDKKDFKLMKTKTMGRSMDIPPQQFYRLQGPEDKTLIFESRFESGNLLASIKVSDNEYDLILQNDINTNGHTQWYFFRVGNTRAGHKVRFNIINLAKPDSLYNYGMKVLCYSNLIKESEGVGWHRIGEQINYYQNSFRKDSNPRFQRYYYSLTFTHTFSHDNDTQFFAHCFPYTYSDLQDDLTRIEKDTNCQNFYHRSTLTRTLAGNKCEYITITSKDKDPKSQKALSKKGVFISARVHPGESNASWMMKGVLDFLVSNTPEARALRDNFVFKIVPILNPDGVINGNYRCSLSGQDLNRRWKNPSKILHPVIFAVKKFMRTFSKERDCALYCDLHGHSRRKNIFMYGNSIKEKPHITRVFPYIMSKLCDFFSFEQSRFSMSKCKESTARIAMFKEMGIPNIFTMEASFCGADRGKFKDQHFTTDCLMLAGRRLMETLIVSCKIDVQLSIKTIKMKSNVSDKSDKESVKKDEDDGIYAKLNYKDVEQELAKNKKLIAMTNGRDDGGSSGSDSSPSADNLEEEEMEKVLPIKKKPKPVKPVIQKPKINVALAKKVKEPQSPNGKKEMKSPLKKPFSYNPFDRFSLRKRKPEMKDAWTQTTPRAHDDRERRSRKNAQYQQQLQLQKQAQMQQHQLMQQQNRPVTYQQLISQNNSVQQQNQPNHSRIPGEQHAILTHNQGGHHNGLYAAASQGKHQSRSHHQGASGHALSGQMQNPNVGSSHNQMLTNAQQMHYMQQNNKSRLGGHQYKQAPGNQSHMVKGVTNQGYPNNSMGGGSHHDQLMMGQYGSPSGVNSVPQSRQQMSGVSIPQQQVRIRKDYHSKKPSENLTNSEPQQMNRHNLEKPDVQDPQKRQQLQSQNRSMYKQNVQKIQISNNMAETMRQTQAKVDEQRKSSKRLPNIPQSSNGKRNENSQLPQDQQHLNLASHQQKMQNELFNTVKQQQNGQTVFQNAVKVPSSAQQIIGIQSQKNAMINQNQKQLNFTGQRQNIHQQPNSSSSSKPNRQLFSQMAVEQNQGIKQAQGQQQLKSGQIIGGSAQQRFSADQQYKNGQPSNGQRLDTYYTTFNGGNKESRQMAQPQLLSAGQQNMAPSQGQKGIRNLSHAPAPNQNGVITSLTSSHQYRILNNEQMQYFKNENIQMVNDQTIQNLAGQIQQPQYFSETKISTLNKPAPGNGMQIMNQVQPTQKSPSQNIPVNLTKRGTVHSIPDLQMNMDSKINLQIKQNQMYQMNPQSQQNQYLQIAQNQQYMQLQQSIDKTMANTVMNFRQPLPNLGQNGTSPGGQAPTAAQVHQYQKMLNYQQHNIPQGNPSSQIIIQQRAQQQMQKKIQQNSAQKNVVRQQQQQSINHPRQQQQLVRQKNPSAQDSTRPRAVHQNGLAQQLMSHQQFGANGMTSLAPNPADPNNSKTPRKASNIQNQMGPQLQQQAQIQNQMQKQVSGLGGGIENSPPGHLMNQTVIQFTPGSHNTNSLKQKQSN